MPPYFPSSLMLARFQYLVFRLCSERLQVAPEILPLAFAPNTNKAVTLSLRIVVQIKQIKIMVVYLLLFSLSLDVVGNHYAFQFPRTSCLLKALGYHYNSSKAIKKECTYLFAFNCNYFKSLSLLTRFLKFCFYIP
jgi:hypothetical protein